MTAAPTLRPRDAASLIVVDRSGETPRVLMGRRHPGHRFMPNRLVFPGGRVEPEDGAMVAVDTLREEVIRRLMARVANPSVRRARALAMAAIRETCEETGLLLGAPISPSRPQTATAWEAFSRHGVTPLLRPMHLLARAITPPGNMKRFDTRFFVMDAEHIAARQGGIVGPDSELVEVSWLSFEQARAGNLHLVTQSVLSELEARLKIGLDAPAPTPLFHTVKRKWLREILE